MSRACLLLAGLLGLAGCETNEAYVDLPTQTLHLCSGGALMDVQVNAPRPATSYFIYWEGPGPLPHAFSFQAPAPGCTITSGGVALADPSRFRLSPNATYTVRSTGNGDVGPSQFLVRTGPDGRIISSDARCK